MTIPVRQAVILCGGLGTRLASLTRNTPKPLLRVGGTPFLQLLIQEITRYGIDRFLLLTAYKAEQFHAFAARVADDLAQSITVDLSVEPDQAGTGGALFHARHKLDETFYLFNGDTLLDVPLDALARQLEDAGTIGCLALRHVPDASRYGVVDLDENRIVGFGRAAKAGEPAWINGGVAAFRRTFVDYLSPNCAFEAQALPYLARENALAAVKADSFFIDIGVPSDFERGQSDIPAYRERPALFFDSRCLTGLGVKQSGSMRGLELLPGATEAVAMANAKGFYVFMIWRGCAIAGEACSASHLNSLTDQIRSEMLRAGARFDDIRQFPGGQFRDGRAVDEAAEAQSFDHNLSRLMSLWPVKSDKSAVVGVQRPDETQANAMGLKHVLVPHGERIDLVVKRHLDGIV